MHLTRTVLAEVVDRGVTSKIFKIRILQADGVEMDCVKMPEFILKAQ